MEYRTTPLLRDLLRVYNDIVRDNFQKNIFLTRSEICLRISTLPAPQLYITPLFARRIINAMDNGRPLAHSPWRARQHHELYKRWLSLPEDERTPQAIEKIILQPAPSFYLSPSRINYLLYKAIKQ